MIRADLPGVELVGQGIPDLERRAETIESLLASLGAPRVRALGFVVRQPFDDAELRLYQILAARHGDGAHARYNAVVRRMVSFQHASACAS